MKKRWVVYEQDLRLQDYIVKSLQINPLIAQILINRGIKTVEEINDFLTSSINNLHDPFLLPDMKKAVERIGRAISSGEGILVYGDYDVDGVTATSLLYLFFKEMGYDASYYIPHRLREGYGLREDAIYKIKKKGIGLIITADCGTTSNPQVAAAQGLGIDVIITDHHEPLDVLPEAYAVINPNRTDSQYPFRDLAGVGVAMKLAQGVLEGFKGSRIQGGNSRGGQPTAERAPLTPLPLDSILHKYLDLVALGTIADVSPLIGENRKLVKEGLKLLSKGERKGIAALKLVSNLDGQNISVGLVGFTLAPRINAAGRLDDADIGVMLLTTDSEEEAVRCAKMMDEKNRERQRIEDVILNEVRGRINKDIDIKNAKAIVLSSENWHQGVIGIIASRIVDEYYRPTILISMREDGIGKGSARSIPAFHLYEGLLECSSYLDAFGGHKYAAGITIRKDRIALFSERINEIVGAKLKNEDFVPRLYIDSEININDLNFKILKGFELLEPFGISNPEPVFSISDVEAIYPKIVGKNHLKLKVRQERAQADAIGFNMGEKMQMFNKSVSESGFDIAVTPRLNEWQGTLSIQMKIKDMKFPDQTF